MTFEEARTFFENNPEVFLPQHPNGKDFICPLCHGGSHGRPLFRSKDGKHFFCYRCFGEDHSASVFTFIAKQYNLTSFREIMSKGAELTGITIEYGKAAPLFDSQKAYNPTSAARPEASREETKTRGKKSKDYTKDFERWNRFICNTDYWRGRGLSLETVNRFKIGYQSNFDVEGKPWDVLILPIGKHGFLIRNTAQSATKDGDKLSRSRERGSPEPYYNPLEIDIKAYDGAIFITEGEFDALSVIQAGGVGIAIRGARKAKGFIDMLLQNPPNEPKTLVLMLDNDEAGKEAAERFIQGLANSFYFPLVLNLSPYNDVNEVLQHEPDELKRLIAQINKDYRTITETLAKERKTP